MSAHMKKYSITITVSKSVGFSFRFSLAFLTTFLHKEGKKYFLFYGWRRKVFSSWAGATLVHILWDTEPWWNRTVLFWHNIFYDGWRIIRRQKALKGLLEGKKWKARGKDDGFIFNKVFLIIHLGGPYQCVIIHFLLMPSSLGISCPLFSL